MNDAERPGGMPVTIETVVPEWESLDTGQRLGGVARALREDDGYKDLSADAARVLGDAFVQEALEFSGEPDLPSFLVRLEGEGERNQKFFGLSFLRLLHAHARLTEAGEAGVFSDDDLRELQKFFANNENILPTKVVDLYKRDGLKDRLAKAVEALEPEAKEEVTDSGEEETEEADLFEKLMTELGLDKGSVHEEVAKVVRQYARLGAMGSLENRGARQIQDDLDRLARADAPDEQVLAVGKYLQGLIAIALAKKVIVSENTIENKKQTYRELADSIPQIDNLKISAEFSLSPEDERQLLEEPLAWFRERFRIIEDVGEAEVGTHFQYLQTGYQFFNKNKETAYQGRTITFREPNRASEEAVIIERNMFEVVKEEYAARMAFIQVFRSWVEARSFQDIKINPEMFRHGRFEWFWKRLAPVIWELERPDHIRAYLNAEERTDRLVAYLGDKEYAKAHGLAVGEDNIYDSVSERWGDELRAAWGLKEGEEIPFWVVRLGYFFWRFNGRAALFDSTAIDVHKILAVTEKDSRQAQGVKRSLEGYLAKHAPGLKVRVKRDIEVLPGSQADFQRTDEGTVQLNGRLLIDSQGAIVDEGMKRQVILHYLEFGTVPKALTVGSGETQGTIRIDIEDPEAVMEQIPEFNLEVSGSLLTAYLHRRGTYDAFARKLFALDYTFLTRGRGIPFAQKALKTGFFDYPSFLEHRFKSGNAAAKALSDEKGEAVLVQNPRGFIGAMANETGARDIEEERILVHQMMAIRFTDFKDTDISDWVGSGVTLENALQALEQFLADPSTLVSTDNKVFSDLYASDKLVFLLYQNPQNPELMARLGVSSRKEEFILNLLKVAVSGLVSMSATVKARIVSEIIRTTFIDQSGNFLKRQRGILEEKALMERRVAYVLGTRTYGTAMGTEFFQTVANIVKAFAGG